MFIVGTRGDGSYLTLFSGVIHTDRRLAFRELEDAHDDNPHMRWEVLGLNETNGPIEKDS